MYKNVLPKSLPKYYRWIVLAAGTLGVFSALGLARFGYSTVLPSMQHNLGLDNTAAGTIASANLIGYLVLSAVGGALASRFGSRIVATIGLVVVGLSMVFTASASGFASAAFWRTITGIGSGAANVSIMGMWATWFSPNLRGRAAGVAVAGSSLALMTTGIMVPQILTAEPMTGWRMCWVLFGAASLGIALLIWLVVRPHSVIMEHVSANDKSRQPAGPSQNDIGTKSSLRMIYRSPLVWHLGAVYAAYGFSYIIYMTFFVKYLVTEHGYSSLDAGKIFFFMGMSSVVCGVLWGTVSDYLGRKTALLIVFFMHTVSFALFATAGSSAVVITSALLFGLSAWSIPAIMAAACGDLLGAVFAPAVLGFITLFIGIGQVLGPGVAGWIADSTGSFGLAFWLAAACSVAGAVGSLLLPGKRKAAKDY